MGMWGATYDQGRAKHLPGHNWDYRRKAAMGGYSRAVMYDSCFVPPVQEQGCRLAAVVLK